MTAAAFAPAPVSAEAGALIFTFGDFSGSLGDLASLLRAGRRRPEEVPLLVLTRQVLARVAAQQLSPDEHAELLPALAGVIALKARLLLPPKDSVPVETGDDWDGDMLDDVLEGVEALAELDALVALLAQRRSERQGLIAARPLELALPRRPRPPAGELGLARLVKAARTAVREVQVPLLARERLTLAGALRALSAFGSRLGRFTFLSVPVADWGERATYFSALLEGVKDGTFQVEQPEAFADIEVRHREGGT
ncbi:segregation/condensation protein A [Deinococcus irradiatisoli]|uniref:Segregation/condensation protein A n=1 Tax=Deinococcus irradiatisoli TaxID=2202254 RepID=A0A2Z3JC98_9DEIO|nr:segregation/condensation protein A [Deinococcus irradiatisoli]AWN22783.1 segregation/condensation protein A [Deinococcus irradiatisoli]